MKVEIPTTGGIEPGARVIYSADLVLPESYRAEIGVVGTYTERAGYGFNAETFTVRRTVWVGETRHKHEEDAVTEAVEKLAEILGKLV